MNTIDSTTTADATAVRTIIDRWAEAIRHKDLAGILLDHAPNVLLFDVPPPLQATGLDAYGESWKAFFSWADDPALFELAGIRVTAGEDVAFVTATVSCTGTDSRGRESRENVRLTIGLQKIDGRWTIVHEHHSVAAEG